MKIMNALGRRGFSLALALLGAAMLSLQASGPARAADPIKIGFGMAMTGSLAGNGKAALIVIEMWKEEINAKGGLLGRPVELVYYDDQTNPALVPGIYSKLLDVDKVDLVISGYGTGVQAAAMPIIMQRNKVFMCFFGLAVNDQFNYKKYFQMQPNGPNPSPEWSEGFYQIALTMNPRPKTIAIVGADAEFPHMAMEGARANAKKYGFQMVYDRTYPPNNVDFAPVIRSIQATNPDIVFVASYPPDSSGIVRAASELNLKTRMFGGGMIGLQFAALKSLLGPALNGLVYYDLYLPEPTMNFPGITEFLKKYQERAPKAGADPLGFYLPPYAYSGMQILAQAIQAVGSLDQNKIAEYIHKNSFDTIVGKLTFAPNGEWAKPRILYAQYQGVVGNDVEQFKKAGKQPILYPKEFQSGKLQYPYADIKRK
jgi:branched-chain amino acid transport system substrate-binding protein